MKVCLIPKYMLLLWKTVVMASSSIVPSFYCVYIYIYIYVYIYMIDRCKYKCCNINLICNINVNIYDECKERVWLQFRCTFL